MTIVNRPVPGQMVLSVRGREGGIVFDCMSRPAMFIGFAKKPGIANDYMLVLDNGQLRECIIIPAHDTVEIL